MVMQSFLLKNSHSVGITGNDNWHYDNKLQMNMVCRNGKVMPVCTISSIVTQSKTEAYPGDDDPDPDVENMY